MFSYEFCEISKNTIFTEQIWTTASVLLWNLIFRPKLLNTEAAKVLKFMSHGI